jgi:tetratricopeptide (TPR) repeat protein
VKSKQEALQTFRELKVHDAWLAETLGGYGASLSLAGRMNEAAKPLDEALAVAKELQNQTLIAQTLRWQAERLFYAGDLKGAALLNEQASQAAAKAADRSLTLTAQASAAMTSAAAQPTRAIAARLAALADEADKIGLKSVSVQCSIERASTLLKAGDLAAAIQEADRALAKADTLGFRLSQAKAHFVRAEAMRLANDQNASREYAQTLRVLNDIKSEDGSQNVIKRADVGAMIAESETRSKGL